MTPITLPDLKPGDTLVVRVGDATTGWLPNDDYLATIGGHVREALDRQGLEDVVVLVLPYAVDFGVLPKAAPDEAATLLRKAQDLIVQQAARIAELEAAANPYVYAAPAIWTTVYDNTIDFDNITFGTAAATTGT